MFNRAQRCNRSAHAIAMIFGGAVVSSGPDQNAIESHASLLHRIKEFIGRTAALNLRSEIEPVVGLQAGSPLKLVPVRGLRGPLDLDSRLNCHKGCRAGENLDDAERFVGTDEVVPTSSGSSRGPDSPIIFSSVTVVGFSASPVPVSGFLSADPSECALNVPVVSGGRRVRRVALEK